MSAYCWRLARLAGQLSEPGPEITKLVSNGFIEIAANGEAPRSVATVTPEGLRAIILSKTMPPSYQPE